MQESGLELKIEYMDTLLNCLFRKDPSMVRYEVEEILSHMANAGLQPGASSVAGLVEVLFCLSSCALSPNVVLGVLSDG
jgi:hypothetical protein